MDSHKDFATRAHDMGWRAYRQYDGLFIQRHDGSGFYVTDRDSIKDWHALRAYQDEQRKKGVPITFPDWDAENRWLTRDHGEIGVYRSSFAVRQEWDQTKRPRIYAFDREHCSAVFTNFRWRAGYPKNV